MSVSDFPYPGNEHARPRSISSALPGVELWWCELANDSEGLIGLAGWLSAIERARAARFATKVLADRYTMARAALRWLLGRRLGLEPGAVSIERDPRGRPKLARGSLDFNISHTRVVALVGITDLTGARIGVDVEHKERTLDHVRLARK